MENPEAQTLAALKLAIKKETESQNYYQQACDKCTIETGKKLFTALAKEEADKCAAFQKIYDSLEQGNSPAAETNTTTTKLKKTRATRLNVSQADCGIVKPFQQEKEAVQSAINMENSSYKFFLKQEENAVLPQVKEIYKAVADEKNAHRTSLARYLEYLTYPEIYFVSAKKENVSAEPKK
jgi:rubrerythrin